MSILDLNSVGLTPEECRRHTASHVMSYAVKMLFPEAKRGAGPHTDAGFYQDFDFGEETVGTELFKKIEKKMRWIVNKNFAVEGKIVTADEAREIFAPDPYKLELIESIIERGEDISLYSFVNEEGRPVYTDLCQGGHVASTGEIGVFKLMKVAGAYWRGDENNPMLTRIYGVAFENEEKLQEYETMLEEAAKRDHRKLGKELDLFTFSDLVGSGLPMFTPKGTFMRNAIESTIMDIQGRYGFEKVCIPHITKKDLYETSGHWGKYKDDLFHVKGKGDTEFVMKPMNCPHHAQIFASKMRSYRELPVRYAETTCCYRDEQPGELLGLSRVRSLTQDDGHIFCRIEQVKEEARNLVAVVREFYTKLEMFKPDCFWVSLSVRDPENLEKYLGDNDNWDKAERFLEEVAAEEDLPFKRIEGEAAFYGPKLDFMFLDAIGREWQLATIQIDFVQPERFSLEFVNEKGEKERPVMIHRAIAGSLERFMSVIIEHFAGDFPLWLAPVQARVLPISEEVKDYAGEIYDQLKKAGVRVEFDESGDSLGKKIRNGETAKIPLLLVIGHSEMENKTVAVRQRGVKEQEVMSVEAVVEKCV